MKLKEVPSIHEPEEVLVGGLRIQLAEPEMRRVFATLDRLAAARTPVVLQGETGVGKEVAARYLHERSLRRERPFVPVNCAAIPEHLAESELFGHERGAFTGAMAARVGLLEAAHEGTLFLDEIGELPASTQGRLLRAVDGGRVRRLGAKSERAIDVRLVSATNRDLRDEVRAKRFRADLSFRIGAATVQIPPLRERRHEIPFLARALLDAERARMGRKLLNLSTDVTTLLQSHDWPGNVRELKHVMELAAASAKDCATEVVVDDVELGHSTVLREEFHSDALPPKERFQPIESQIRALIRTQMVLALQATDGNQSEAARLLKMPRRTFAMRMKQFAITSAIFRRRAAPGQ